MNTLFRTLAGGLAFATATLVSSAQISASFDFDSAASGSLASTFSTSQISFHQAVYTPSYDGFGDAIAGSEHWAIDPTGDSLYPLTVDNPETFLRGAAPSGSNALQALWQPVLISFNQPYRLQSFSVTLDNDLFGNLDQIRFVSADAILRQLTIDQSHPGLMIAATDLGEITGVVLPAGAFYDNLSLTLVPVPEPSTYGLLGAAALFGLVGLRRRRSRK